MEEAKALAQHQQQLLLQHQAQQHQAQQNQQQQQQQQQFLLLQQLQQQQQQQQQQAAAISRFPSNIDAHLRPPGLHHRPIPLQQQNPNPNPNPNSNLQQQQQQQQQNQQNPQQPPQQQPQQQSQQQKVMRPLNQVELQMAYQDAWRVCHPDFKRPFTSLEDACERLLPYHVVADYEAEEDDRILDSDTTGQMPSRSQQWDNNIAAKVAEFTGTFEKQVLAFNMISSKRAAGEFRSEERLMIEQALLQEEKRAMLELKAEIELREKAGREAQEARLRMAMVQAEQARGPIRGSALASQGNSSVPIGHHDVGEQQEHVNPDEMINGWGNITQRDEKEPSEDFLNDDETENGDTAMQDEWREVGEFDLNSR